MILTQHPPVCTDLLTIGAGAVIRRDTFLSGYRAEAGVIRTGPVTIGAGAFVGQAAVLDIGATLGDGAQLGHGSALYEGQTVPAGERWQGTPAAAHRHRPAGGRASVRQLSPGRARTPCSSLGLLRSTCRWHSAAFVLCHRGTALRHALRAVRGRHHDLDVPHRRAGRVAMLVFGGDARSACS